MSPSSRESVNPYAAPAGGYSPAVTFRISSLLLVIAVIAVCMGVAHENLIMGIILAVAVTPALLYTVIAAAGRKARGRPMAVLDKVGTFLAAIVGVVVIAVSAFIAFGVTCYSSLFMMGWSLDNASVAGWVGIGSAVAAAAFMTRFLLGRKGRRSGIAGKP